jgi:hypothetical protein
MQFIYMMNMKGRGTSKNGGEFFIMTHDGETIQRQTDKTEKVQYRCLPVVLQYVV